MKFLIALTLAVAVGCAACATNPTNAPLCAPAAPAQQSAPLDSVLPDAPAPEPDPVSQEERGVSDDPFDCPPGTSVPGEPEAPGDAGGCPLSHELQGYFSFLVLLLLILAATRRGKD